MPTITTNFSLNKPLVNNATDEDLWGDYMNTNMDTIDAALKPARDMVHTSKTTGYTVVIGDRNKMIGCDATSAAFTITLLAAATAGDGFMLAIKKTDSSGNAITIDGNASETIDGETTATVSSQYDSVLLKCDGSNWHIVAQKIAPTSVSAASETVSGTVELATQTETNTGTDDARAVTPLKLNKAQPTAAAWGKITVSGGTPSLADSYNVTSITDSGTGIYTVNLTNAMSSANYVVVANASRSGFASDAAFTVTIESMATGSFRLEAHNQNGVLVDSASVYFVVFGDRA